ncbi:hypothetical protein L1049_022885 [Liquidambar formosana]|uniref:Calcineurin-like phosphoesterase domain-containing protein n=1 Tax=Liquidambar formosana TaxID=63359 RepID=A0AAP0WRV0_LIQFO
MLSALWHASTLCCLSSSSLSPSSSTSKPNARLPMASSVRIAVVGDVHDDWNLQEDTKALQLLQPDLVLFTGDFGNENVELVRSIANLEMTKAVHFGEPRRLEYSAVFWKEEGWRPTTVGMSW